MDFTVTSEFAMSTVAAEVELTNATEAAGKMETLNTCEWLYTVAITEIFTSPEKNTAQCSEVRSKWHGIREQNDFKANWLQLSSFTNLLSSGRMTIGRTTIGRMTIGRKRILHSWGLTPSDIYTELCKLCFSVTYSIKSFSSCVLLRYSILFPLSARSPPLLTSSPGVLNAKFNETGFVLISATAGGMVNITNLTIISSTGIPDRDTNSTIMSNGSDARLIVSWTPSERNPATPVELRVRATDTLGQASELTILLTLCSCYGTCSTPPTGQNLSDAYTLLSCASCDQGKSDYAWQIVMLLNGEVHPKANTLYLVVFGALSQMAKVWGACDTLCLDI